MFRKLPHAGTPPPTGAITIDGLSVKVEEGEPLAAVLLRADPPIARLTPVNREPRAPFCMMGACFECLVEVDGEPSSRSYVIRTRPGMVVRRQRGRPGPGGIQ